MEKKLYRSPKDGLAFGVCSGLARYFDKDPVLIRLIFVVLAFVTNFWPMIVAYGLLFLLVPVDPAQASVKKDQEPKDVTASSPQEGQPTEPSESPRQPEREESFERMDGGQNM